MDEEKKTAENGETTENKESGAKKEGKISGFFYNFFF